MVSFENFKTEEELYVDLVNINKLNPIQFNKLFESSESDSPLLTDLESLTDEKFLIRLLEEM